MRKMRQHPQISNAAPQQRSKQINFVDLNDFFCNNFEKCQRLSCLLNKIQVAKFHYKFEMSGIDEGRHFRNSFRDFDPANPDPEILSRSGLSDQFLRTLRFHRNRLLKRHYQEYSRCKDDDQTVYTGKLLLS